MNEKECKRKAFELGFKKIKADGGGPIISLADWHGVAPSGMGGYGNMMGVRYFLEGDRLCAQTSNGDRFYTLS